MIYRTMFPRRDVFAELDRLQRDFRDAFEFSPNIRGRLRGGFPGMNVGRTPKSVEVYLFVPGVDPSALDIQLEKGVLTIAGERTLARTESGKNAPIRHIEERFEGRFRRVVTLPDDIRSDAVDAHYRDGVLHISIPRREAALPRRITVQ